MEKKNKKNSLQYLLKARCFMFWTLLGLGHDKNDHQALDINLDLDNPKYV